LLTRLGQKQQRGMSRRDRLKQLESAFAPASQGKIRGAHLVLVDDVITTGATLEAAARILKAAGAKRVSAVVFAQA
jgi:predicted amidophosphoribosyltransferase